MIGPWPGRSRAGRARECGAGTRGIPRGCRPCWQDDDRSAAPGEIAAVEVACLFVEEAEVVGRVAGGVQRDEPRVSAGNDLGVPAAIRRVIAHVCLRPAREKRRNTANVIRMRVRDQHPGERRLAQRARDGVEVRRHADTGVDQRRQRTWKQVGVVPFRTGPGRRVPCGNPQHHSENSI
jgi:hypothetical protein